MDDKAHKELLEVLKAHKGPVLISGYDSKLYDDMLQGWHREETTCYSQACTKERSSVDEFRSGQTNEFI